MSSEIDLAWQQARALRAAGFGWEDIRCRTGLSEPFCRRMLMLGREGRYRGRPPLVVPVVEPAIGGPSS